MAYNFQAAMPTNHPFLSAGQNMPPPPGVAQPGVMQPTGQFPLNPGMMPGMGPVPNGQFPPINPGVGPVMTPPHVIAGQPGVPPVPGGAPPVPMAPMPHEDHNNFDRQGWHQAMQAYRQSMPNFGGGNFDETALQSWLNQRPSRSSFYGS